MQVMYRYFPQTPNVLDNLDLMWKENLCTYYSMAGFLCHFVGSPLDKN